MNERAFSPRSRPGRPSRRFWAFRLLARSERGTALIEFALVLPILALLIFGGIDFGFVFKDFISARQGVGDAARQAAVGQFGTPRTCTLDDVRAGAPHRPTSNLMCARALADGTRQPTVCGWRSYVGDKCAPDKDGYTQGQPITICAEYKLLNSVTGILSSSTATSRRAPPPR